MSGTAPAHVVCGGCGEGRGAIYHDRRPWENVQMAGGGPGALSLQCLLMWAKAHKAFCPWLSCVCLISVLSSSVSLPWPAG